MISGRLCKIIQPIPVCTLCSFFIVWLVLVQMVTVLHCKYNLCNIQKFYIAFCFLEAFACCFLSMADSCVFGQQAGLLMPSVKQKLQN